VIATLLTIGLPSLMVLVGILMNRDAVNAIRKDIDRLDGRMTKLEDNMNSLRGEMAALRTSFHNDVIMLMERDTKLEQRVARLERAS